MSAELILALLNGVLGAAPELLALFQKANTGGTVAATDVTAVLSKYGIDRAVFAAAIAAAEAHATATGAAVGSASGK